MLHLLTGPVLPVGSTLVADADGAPWRVTTDGLAERIDAAGRATDFAVTPGHALSAPVLGADGRIWAVEDGLGVVRVASDGSADVISIPSTTITSIAPGPNGHMWGIGRTAESITEIGTDGSVVLHPTGLVATDRVRTLRSGRDGDLWTAVSSHRNETLRRLEAGVVRFDGSGTARFTAIASPEQASDVVVDAADGVFVHRGFAVGSGGADHVSHVAEDGTVTQVPLSGQDEVATALPNGTVAVGVTAGVSGRIVTLGSSGVVSDVPFPTGHQHEVVLAEADGEIWASGLTETASSASPSLDHYDPTTRTWTSIPTRDWHTSGLLVHGRLLLADGGDGGPMQIVRPTSIAVDRTSGDDRFATTVALAKRAWPGHAPVVYVATGADYPDALVAGAAAAHAGGPLLLTATDDVPGPVAAEIAALAPTRIVLVGGTAAVTTRAESELRSIAKSLGNGAVVDRIGGSDRFDTARRVDRDAFATPVTGLYVATGDDFPDALSAAAAAGTRGEPVVLVDGHAARTDAPTGALLDDLGTTHVVVAGGDAAVDAAIVADLQHQLGASAVVRAAGDDRFATSVALAATAHPDGASGVYLTTALGFADALAGSAVAAHQGAAMLVVRPECIPPGVDLELGLLDPASITVIGGETALSSSVATLTVCS
ncbi:cell wall-binding repeat-containing protein [Curtobacterium sp. RRHDQ10]|uniref:cell wall-binding repeat-containing protein n=1 Tax=Curtobacterium phyllosphaerae TaxID=3413379 RepID=UPI003BF2D6C6